MSRRVMPFGLLASGVRGEATNNMKSTGTVATSRSNRAALKRRVFTRCKNNKNGSCSSESVEEPVEEEVVEEEEAVEEEGGESTEIFEDLNNPSEVSVVSSGGNKYVLNGNTTYNENTRYYLYNGGYTLTNIPMEHPMAIINDTVNIIVLVAGNVITGTGPNGEEIPFFYGFVSIKVDGDFGTASLYCLNHGYMGGENVLVYNSS